MRTSTEIGEVSLGVYSDVLFLKLVYELLLVGILEMLKGFLLSNIREDKEKEKINKLWKRRMLDLVELGRDLDVKNEEIEACKAWLRAKHAEQNSL